MRAVLQRVNRALVKTSNKSESIQHGILIFLGIEESDTREEADWMVKKIMKVRIFNDEDGVMNKSVKEVNGNILLVSQFTLHASTRKGNRPSYIKAAKPEVAIPVYEKFIKALTFDLQKPIKTGEFGADMKISLVNDGPVTIIIDTKDKK